MISVGVSPCLFLFLRYGTFSIDCLCFIVKMFFFFGRPNREARDVEIKEIERKVDRFKKTLQTLKSKTLPSYVSGARADETAKEKRLKKIHGYNLAIAMEELTKDIVEPTPLRETLLRCSEAEKTIALLKDKSEDDIETNVCQKLRTISDKIDAIQKQKSVESKCSSDFDQAKAKYSSAKRAAESSTSRNDQNKIEQYKDEMDECETRLEKERDIYASFMYDLLAEEDAIIQCLVTFSDLQRKYLSEAMKHMTDATNAMRLIKGNSKNCYLSLSPMLRLTHHFL